MMGVRDDISIRGMGRTPQSLGSSSVGVAMLAEAKVEVVGLACGPFDAIKPHEALAWREVTRDMSGGQPGALQPCVSSIYVGSAVVSLAASSLVCLSERRAEVWWIRILNSSNHHESLGQETSIRNQDAKRRPRVCLRFKHL